MLNLKPYMNLVKMDGFDGYHINMNKQQIGNVTAVFVDAISGEPLDCDFAMGIDITIDGIEKWVADFRHTEWWCMPKFGKNLSDIPDETQGLIYKKKDGLWGVILPVVSEQYKCVLKGGNKCITAKLFSWCDGLSSVKGLAFLHAEGDNPYTLLSDCAKTATNLLNNGCKTREDRHYPEVFEYLGWCSWDAFTIRVDEESLIKKCEEFKEKNIPVKWAILDDMWGDVRDFYDRDFDTRDEMFNIMKSSKLYSFEACKKRFPNGLKACIEKINEYDIKVGMWHPTIGYWRGIDKDGDIYKECKDYLIKAKNGMYIHSFERDKAYVFYKKFHDFLKESGAEFIKIDNQSMSRCFYKGLAPVGEVARQFHDAMETSVREHFDSTMINCMGMASEDMWNRSRSPISRCSDDFQPENREWFSKHILQCAFNCLVQGQLYYCDWDMWWTDDAQAVKNSVLRAISGGPIYISDTLHRSRKEILDPLVFSDGKILRCDRPAMPTTDCLTDDPLRSGNIFKVQNVCGNSGVIAAFNLDEKNKSVSGTISPSDIDGLVGDSFVIYDHFTQEYTILGKEEKIKVTLKDADEFKLYVIVPVVDGFAPIGRIDKFVSPKSIKCVNGENIELYECGKYAYVKDGKLYINE